MIQKEILLQKVTTIQGALKNYCDDDKIDLFSGSSGVNLFLFHSNGSEDYIINNIVSAIKIIENGCNLHTFCSGISGFLWSLRYLVDNNFLNESEIDIFDQLDPILFQKMQTDLKLINWDFLHGAIGLGLYFLKRLHKRECKDYLKELVVTLNLIAIKELDGSLKWSSIKYGSNDEIIYNISLSHGIASIINILVRIYKAGIEEEKCEYLIQGAVKFILKQEIDKSIYNSYFPSWAIESENALSGSRLGWCYGDLGIAITIWQAGKVFNNFTWTDKAIEVLKHAATRRDLQANSVMDAGICHGSAGIGHVFYRMWWNTRLPEFKDAADYWFNETLKMAYHKDGLAGYKTWYSEEYGRWQNEIGLLDGVAGIGLALMTYHYEIEPKWDECLLLS